MSTKRAGNNNEVMIEIRQIDKWFGSFQALRKFDLMGRRQEAVVICGLSGPGKSTLIRTINRLEQHQEGQIIVEGTELTNEWQRASLIS